MYFMVKSCIHTLQQPELHRNMLYLSPISMASTNSAKFHENLEIPQKWVDSRSLAQNSTFHGKLWSLFITQSMHQDLDTVALLVHLTLHLTAPDLWPPNSRNLNLMDHKVWAITQERVCSSSMLDIAHLTAAWSGLQQHVFR